MRLIALSKGVGRSIGNKMAVLNFCKKHGDVRHFRQVEIDRIRWRCCKCNAEGVSRHRRSKKKWCVAYLGGECQRCGYSRCQEALEFHHRDKGDKEFQFARYQKASYEKLAKELDKCDLLCANCHREMHAQHINK